MTTFHAQYFKALNSAGSTCWSRAVCWCSPLLLCIMSLVHPPQGIAPTVPCRNASLSEHRQCSVQHRRCHTLHMRSVSLACSNRERAALHVCSVQSLERQDTVTEERIAPAGVQIL